MARIRIGACEPKMRPDVMEKTLDWLEWIFGRPADYELSSAGIRLFLIGLVTVFVLPWRRD